MAYRVTLKVFVSKKKRLLGVTLTLRKGTVNNRTLARAICWAQDLLHEYSSINKIVLVPSDPTEESRNLELHFFWDPRMNGSSPEDADCYEVDEDGRSIGDNLFNSENEHIKSIQWKLRDKDKILKALAECENYICSSIDKIKNIINETMDD